MVVVRVLVVFGTLVMVSWVLVCTEFVFVLFELIVGRIAMVPIACILIVSVIVPIDFDAETSHIVPTVLEFGVLGIVPHDTIVGFVEALLSVVMLCCSIMSCTKGGSVTSFVFAFAS